MAPNPLSVNRGEGGTRLRFWSAFKEYMASASRVRCAKATSEDWMNHSACLNGGSLFSVQRTRLGEIGVQFALDDLTSSSIYSYLESRRSEIDAGFVEEVRWHDPVGRRTCLIEVRRSANTTLREEWPQQFDWLRRQLERFQDVLWPIVGRVPVVGEPRRWDEQSFLAELGQLNPTSFGPARQIMERAPEYLPDVFWGHGRRAGSCTPRLRVCGVPHQFFTLTTSGTVVFRFVDMKKAEPFASAAHRLQIVSILNQARFLALPDDVINRRPALPLPMFGDQDAQAALFEAVDRFVQVCRTLA